MYKHRLIAAAGLIAALSPSFAFAQETGNSPEIVVVTATRLPTPQAQIASSLTLVTAEDIAREQFETMPDLLKDVPGLNVVQTGGPGGQTSVFMRGTNSDHVKVLIDGIDVSDPSSPPDSFDFGQLPTQDIERVEILRGPQSGLYGSDAIGGVINVITKSGSGPATFTGSVEGGSFGTLDEAGGISGSADQFHYAANIQHAFSGGTPVTPGDLLAPGEARNDDRYANLTASTKLGFDVTDNFDLNLVARYTDSHLLFTGDDFNFFPSIPDAQQSVQDVIQYATRGTAHLVLFGGVFEQTLGAAYLSNRTIDVSPDSGESINAGDRVKVDWQGVIHLGSDETLLLGAEHSRDELRFPISAGTSINSGYAELQSNLAPNFYDSVSVRYDANENFGSAVTWRVAPTYLIAATGTKLKASIGTGFKAPSLSELFESFPSFDFFGNPNLRPEKSTGYDIGFEQSLADARLQFGATWFHNDIKDLIDDNATFTMDIKFDIATTEGVESYISYQPVRTLTLRADYTYTEATGTEPTMGIFNQELVRRPKHKASLDAQWRVCPDISLDATLLYVGPWLDFTRDALAENTIAPSYFTANLAASYAISDEFTLYGRVNNLLGAHYQNPIGFLQPGRGFFAGVRAKI